MTNPMATVQGERRGNRNEAMTAISSPLRGLDHEHLVALGEAVFLPGAAAPVMALISATPAAPH